MMRHTGGVAFGATSTRSRPFSSARLMAFGVSRIPSCLPSGEITRTCGTLMRWLRRIAANGSTLRRWYEPGRAPPAEGNEMAIKDWTGVLGGEASRAVRAREQGLFGQEKPTLYAEAFPTRATCFSVRVRKFEAAGHQRAGIIHVRALEIKGALAVDEHADTPGPDQDVAALRFGHELHLIA